MPRFALPLVVPLFFVPLLVAPSLARADEAPPWSQDTEPRTVAACRAATALPLPDPQAAGPAPKGCDTEALYYGIGAAPDDKAARACALHTPPDPDDVERQAFDGPAALAMIYANGRGVPRNDDLALAYACRAGGAPAEIDGRVAHLLDRKAKGAAGGPFDICDDITSGLMQGACQARDSRLVAVKRNAILAAATARLDGPAKAAYAALTKAQAAYAEALGENEVDQSGTGRAALTLAAEDGESDAFADIVRNTLEGTLPARSAADFPAADKALNAAYGKVVKLKPDALGTVTVAGIKTTERAWLAYRNAFLAFGKVAAPRVAADALATALTRRRVDNLQGLLGGAD